MTIITHVALSNQLQCCESLRWAACSKRRIAVVKWSYFLPSPDQPGEPQGSQEKGPCICPQTTPLVNLRPQCGVNFPWMSNGFSNARVSCQLPYSQCFMGLTERL